MQIRVRIRKDGTVDVTFRPTRPGEDRLKRYAGVKAEDVKATLAAGVTRMRAQTRMVNK